MGWGFVSAIYRQMNEPLGGSSRLPIPHISCHNSPMRRILTSVVLLVLLFPSLASGETLYDLIINNGLYYKPFTNVPFTGTLTV